MAICPHCKKAITKLLFDTSTTETAYGHEWGECALDGRSDEEPDDSETTDYDNFETGDTTYQCPLCEHDIDDLKVLKDLGQNKLGDFPKTKRPRKY